MFKEDLGLVNRARKGTKAILVLLTILKSFHFEVSITTNLLCSGYKQSENFIICIKLPLAPNEHQVVVVYILLKSICKILKQHNKAAAYDWLFNGLSYSQNTLCQNWLKGW